MVGIPRIIFDTIPPGSSGKCLAKRAMMYEGNVGRRIMVARSYGIAIKQGTRMCIRTAYLERR